MYCLVAVLFIVKTLLSKIISPVRMYTVTVNLWTDELRNIDNHCFIQKILDFIGDNGHFLT